MLVSFIIIPNRLFPIFCAPIFGNLIKDIDFVISSFNVVLSTLLNFQSNVAVVFKIFSQPDRWKMAPAKFLNYNVSIEQNFTNMNWMVSSNLIVRHTFILTRILIFIKTFTEHIPQRSKIFVLIIRKLVTMLSVANTRCIVVSWLWSLRLVRLLRRARHMKLRVNAIFNLINFCNQTFHAIKLTAICGIFFTLNWW